MPVGPVPLISDIEMPNIATSFSQDQVAMPVQMLYPSQHWHLAVIWQVPQKHPYRPGGLARTKAKQLCVKAMRTHSTLD
jgi:hypothetical protein